MSTKDPNMKVIIGADTKDFDKGAKAVKQGLKDLDKTSSQALGALGDAFGINTGKVGQMTSALTGLGQKMSQCGSAGVAAFGNILKAIGPVGGAIAGIGIGAAIAGFKELQKEADAFKATVEGANMGMTTAAYVDTYKQILRDFNGDTGKALAETESRFKKFWGTLGITIREFYTTGAWMGAGTEGGAQAIDEYTRRINAAAAGAKTAEEITNQIYNLERRRKEQAIELAKLNDDIASKMTIAKDTSASVAERQDAVYKIELMLAQKKAMTVSLEETLAGLYRQRSALASDSVAAADATLAQETRVYEASRAITQEQNSLLRIKNSLGIASEKFTAALQKQKAIIDQEVLTMLQYLDRRNDMNALQGEVFSNLPTLQGQAVGPKLDILGGTEEFKSRLVAEMGEVTLYVGLRTDAKNVQDISNEITSLLESGISRTSEIIGNLVGTLAGGGDAWGDFKNAALSAFGDMAIAVGKIAIAAGLASEGIQAALHMDNPYIAIAAGAALVALGSAVKSSLSAVASGDYSAGGGGYSGGYSASTKSSDWETREVNINVTGSLEANGDQLVAVISRTNQKNYYLGGQ